MVGCVLLVMSDNLKLFVKKILPIENIDFSSDLIFVWISSTVIVKY